MIKEQSVTVTESQDAEGGFLAWLLLLGQQEDVAVDLPPGDDALAVAGQVRQCVDDGHLTGAERWTVLDVAAHIGWCSDAGTLPASWVRSGLDTAHRVFLARVGGSPSFCPQCDAPVPAQPDLDPEAMAAYERALTAEPDLRAVVRAVDALLALVRPSDQLCHGCVWTTIVKPMCTPLIGSDRGHLPGQAADPDPDGHLRAVDLGEVIDRLGRRPEPETETERWLRSGEAWDAFTGVLLRRIESADPANGCGIGRVTV